jgi:flavin-dependent dehydrogenase
MRWRSYKTVAMEGIIICGDAASIIDPAAGQGILAAIYSGIKAAETAASCMNNPEKEPEYLVNYSTWFTNETTKKMEQVKEFYSKKFVAFNNMRAV